MWMVRARATFLLRQLPHAPSKPWKQGGEATRLSGILRGQKRYRLATFVVSMMTNQHNSLQGRPELCIYPLKRFDAGIKLQLGFVPLGFHLEGISLPSCISEWIDPKKIVAPKSSADAAQRLSGKCFERIIQNAKPEKAEYWWWFSLSSLWNSGRERGEGHEPYE